MVTPFVRTELAYDKAGLLEFTNEHIEAQKADGSRMWGFTTSIEHRRDIFMANGDEIRTNELIEKKSTYPKRYTSIPSQSTSRSSCQSESDVKSGWVIDGTESIGGFRVVRRVYKTGQRVMTDWNALDADCALVQARLDHKDGVSEQMLQSLQVGEPDSAIFTVPDRFEEVPPSGLYVQICLTNGKCKMPISELTKLRLDKNYFELRTSAGR